jgi:hypothetical protein
MALFPLGILSAAGAGGAVGDYELIETQILGSSQASVTFSSLATYASTYKHLQFRTVTRTNRAAVGDDLIVNFNADFGSNYSNHALYGLSGSVTSNAGTNTTAMNIIGSAGGNNSNIMNVAVIDILDAFSTTKNKTIRTLAGQSDIISLNSGSWRNTASLTSITFDARYGTALEAPSRFSLYGIRG